MDPLRPDNEERSIAAPREPWMSEALPSPKFFGLLIKSARHSTLCGIRRKADQ
jgi:hypothetical protein